MIRSLLPSLSGFHCRDRDQAASGKRIAGYPDAATPARTTSIATVSMDGDTDELNERSLES
jgi:hypothetical protein